MIQKILKIIVPIIFIVISIGIGLQYYITTKLTPEDLICHKGALLAQLSDSEPIYTKVKDIHCEIIAGRLVLNYE